MEEARSRYKDWDWYGVGNHHLGSGRTEPLRFGLYLISLRHIGYA